MLGDLLQRRPDGASDVQAAAFGSRSRTPITPANTNRASYLGLEKIDLGLNGVGTGRIASVPQFLKLFRQVPQAALVFAFGLRIEQLARIAQTSDFDIGAQQYRTFVGTGGLAGEQCPGFSEQIERVKFLTGMLQHALNIAQSFDIPQRKRDVAIADGPVLAVTSEYP